MGQSQSSATECTGGMCFARAQNDKFVRVNRACSKCELVPCSNFALCKSRVPEFYKEAKGGVCGLCVQSGLGVLQVRTGVDSDCPFCLDSGPEKQSLVYKCGHFLCMECAANALTAPGEKGDGRAKAVDPADWGFVAPPRGEGMGDAEYDSARLEAFFAWAGDDVDRYDAFLDECEAVDAANARAVNARWRIALRCPQCIVVHGFLCV